MHHVYDLICHVLTHLIPKRPSVSVSPLVLRRFRRHRRWLSGRLPQGIWWSHHAEWDGQPGSSICRVDIKLFLKPPPK